jgi:16S rRNA (cytosine967-C5)-methyltransferase
VRVVCADATQPEAWWDGRPFGAIMLDAPCTGSGILRTRPEAKLRQSEASLALLQGQQLALLRATWPLLAEGGELLYTTCSVLAGENQGVLAEFVAGEPSAIPAALAPPTRADGAACAASPEGITFFPSAAHQGGFVALLRKTAPAVPATPRRPRTRRRRRAFNGSPPGK